MVAVLCKRVRSTLNRGGIRPSVGDFKMGGSRLVRCRGAPQPRNRVGGQQAKKAKRFISPYLRAPGFDKNKFSTQSSVVGAPPRQKRLNYSLGLGRSPITECGGGHGLPPLGLVFDPARGNPNTARATERARPKGTTALRHHQDGKGSSSKPTGRGSFDGYIGNRQIAKFLIF